MATTFDRPFFQNFKFSPISLKNFTFSGESFTFLYHFFLIDFDYVLVNFRNFKGSGKVKKSNMADPRWPPFQDLTQLLRDMTSSAYVVDFNGNIFGRIFRPASFVVIALLYTELRGGGRINPPPRSQKTKKSPV